MSTVADGKVIDKKKEGVLKTYISGFDELFSEGGIPKGSTILVAGGAGVGKSTLCRQICYNLVSKGKKCMYVSCEETIERIERSMLNFGWDITPYKKDGYFLLQKVNPLDILRMKFGSLGGSGSATDVSYKIKPLVIPKDFKPDVIAVDSLTAIIAASISKEKNYRLYLQQLFSFFEETGATSFLISETEQIPTRYSDTGIEEFLADGIVVLYNIQRGDVRESAIEVVKMRYSSHQKKIVSMEITDNGIIIHPDKRVLLVINK
ncbi:MAG: ATPase domain-containing protein [Candidatus Thermoplasmatota archaeon]